MDGEFDNIIAFRRVLHQHPERSGMEEMTAKRVKGFIKKYHPDEIIEKIAGQGIAFRFNAAVDGPVVLIRCELDALPIAEVNTFSHRSIVDTTAHKCGHDGHMAIVSGLAAKLSGSKLKKGSVILLFQPAEETGQGARMVVNDPKFAQIQPDYVYALHNIPGYPMNAIICKQGTFSLASVGVTIKLIGKTSHAGEPEKGINPARAVADLTHGIIDLPNKSDDYQDFVLSTIVHIDLGEIAFGTSAGYAELRATLRGNLDKDVELLKGKVIEMVNKISKRDSLQGTYEFVEYFPAVINQAYSYNIVHLAAQENKLTWIEKEKPFPWSEDFSHLINTCQGVMFGLGAGENTPQLHNPDYDFPDEIIESGVNMFYSIINQHLA